MGWEIAPGLDDAAVPTLLLQPLVENALKYAVATRAGRRTRRHRSEPERRHAGAERDRQRTRVRRARSGPGSGIGIPSVRGRLELLYGASHRFALDRNPDGGVRASVDIPYRKLEEATNG